MQYRQYWQSCHVAMNTQESKYTKSIHTVWAVLHCGRAISRSHSSWLSKKRTNILFSRVNGERDDACRPNLIKKKTSRVQACISRENFTITMMTSWNESFSALLTFCEGNPPITSGLPSQRPVTRSFDALLSAWTNGWANHRDAGDLRRHRTHYDVTVMWWLLML